MVKKLTSEAAAKFLSDLPLDKCFYVQNGPVIKNLEEFIQALESMSDASFSYHRNGTKNDFYNWILFVIGDSRLANEVGTAKTKETTLKKAKARVGYLKSIKEKVEK
jgi:hypothetical protein